MAIASTAAEVDYPESDGKPMAETPQHGEVMFAMIQGLKHWFAADPSVYVSGNMFLYYVEGKPRFNVSPDVMVVRGVEPGRDRRTYKTWEDGGKGPDLVIEVTSKSTRGEDKQKKYRLYQDDLKVREYFLFDPYGEWLRPSMQGHRLVDGEYEPIEPVEGRLPSEVLGLHLERDGQNLRLFNPATGLRLLTVAEREENERAARLEHEATIRRRDAELLRKEDLISQVTAESSRKDEVIHQAETEIERLRREIEKLKSSKKPK